MPKPKKRWVSKPTYRIRWRLVSVQNFNGYAQRPRCIAERYVPILWGLLGFYWPVTNGRGWVCTKEEAAEDIEADFDLHFNPETVLPDTTWYDPDPAFRSDRPKRPRPAPPTGYSPAPLRTDAPPPSDD